MQGKALSDKDTNLQTQINQINSDLAVAKLMKWESRHIDVMYTDDHGKIYYDFNTSDTISEVPSAIAQNNYYTVNTDVQVIGTFRIDDHTIRVYFDKKVVPAQISMLYKVKL